MNSLSLVHLDASGFDIAAGLTLLVTLPNLFLLAVLKGLQVLQRHERSADVNPCPTPKCGQ